MKDEADIRARWYKLIAAAFLPSATPRRLGINVIKAWTADFIALHKRTKGPLPVCNNCTSKCYYNYDVSQFMDKHAQLTFEQVMQRNDPPEAIAWAANNLTQHFFGTQDVDISYCFAVNWLKDQGLTTDAQQTFLDRVRLRLAEQYSLATIDPKVASSSPRSPEPQSLGPYGDGVRRQIVEVIVRQALVGAPWEEICAAVMKANNITPEEIKCELALRRSEH